MSEPWEPKVESGDVAQDPTDTSKEPSVDLQDSPADSEEPRFDVAHGVGNLQDEAEEEDPSLTD